MCCNDMRAISYPGETMYILSTESFTLLNECLLIAGEALTNKQFSLASEYVRKAQAIAENMRRDYEVLKAKARKH